MKRNYIDEILRKRTRAGQIGRHIELTTKVHALKAAVDLCKKYLDKDRASGDEILRYSHGTELHKYIPIGTVACMESYFRSVSKELIDIGSPYRERVSDLNKAKDIKFDFAVVQAIEGRSVTMGDFISHLLPIKNIADINGVMSTIIGEDFLEKLKTALPEWADVQLKTITIDEFAADIYRDVAKIFELRHIYCHEFAVSEPMDINLIYRCFEHTRIFLEATDTLVWNLIDPNAPTSQVDMNQRAHDDFVQSDAELTNLCNEITSSLEPEERAGFQELQRVWGEYRRKKAELAASAYKGGTAAPLVYYAELHAVTKARLDELKLEEEERAER